MINVFLYEESREGSANASMAKSWEGCEVFLGTTTMVAGREDESLPEAIVYLPDFGIVVRGVEEFAAKIRELLDAGYKFEVVGLAYDEAMKIMAVDTALFRKVLDDAFEAGYRQGWRKRAAAIGRATGTSEPDIPRRTYE